MCSNGKYFYNISYLEMYERDIAPRLREIDLLVKTSDNYISVQDAASVLDLSEKEVRDIMNEEGISKLDKKTFFKVMQNGSSCICRFFKRETECGSPYIYSRENIAYIYEIDISTIEKACDDLGFIQVTDYSLPLLLAEIPVYVSI